MNINMVYRNKRKNRKEKENHVILMKQLNIQNNNMR